MMPPEEGPTSDELTAKQLAATNAILDRSAALQLMRSEAFAAYCENANHHHEQRFLEEFVEVLNELGV